MKYHQSKVGPRNRITLPKEVCEHLGVGVGNAVLFTITPEGEVRMETEKQVLARIRSGFPENGHE